MSISSEIMKKPVDLKDIAKKAIHDEKILTELMDGVLSDTAKMKYGCAKVLRLLAENNPDVLYRKWEFFVKLLQSENTFIKCDAVFIIGQMTNVDSGRKFESLFEKFYSLLDDKSMITAANLIGISSVIAKAKPALQSKITDHLLRIDETHHGLECKNVLKGHIIDTFTTYFEESNDKKKVLEFIKKEAKNARPGTRKKAEAFLKKWEDNA